MNCRWFVYAGYTGECRKMAQTMDRKHTLMDRPGRSAGCRTNFPNCQPASPSSRLLSIHGSSAVELDDLHVTAVGIEKGREEAGRSLLQFRDPGHADCVQVGHRFVGVLDVEVDHRPDRFGVLLSNLGPLVEHEEHAADI